MARVKIYPNSVVAEQPIQKIALTKWQLLKIALFGLRGDTGSFWYNGKWYYIYEPKLNDEVEFYAEAEEE